MNFTKLYHGLLASTVWALDVETRIVWITLLCMTDEDGFAAGTVPGLAHFARVKRAAAEKAVKVLSSPDPDSNTQEYEGRRIRSVDGGWVVLNHRKYRDMQTKKQKQAAKRQKTFRERKKDSLSEHYRKQAALDAE